MKVITVFKTHVDIGFTDLPQKVLAGYSGKWLSNVVEVCEQMKDTEHPYIWTMPAFALHYALRHCSLDLKERTEQLIRDNIIVWHALPLTLTTEFFSGYELRQLFYYSRDLSRRYDKPLKIAAKMTDVPGHTQALVDALCENGVKFLHLGCNPACTCPEVPELFFWESKNGNRILTWYNKDYGASVIPPDGWNYPVYLSMNVTNDNSGVHGADTISKLKAELNAYDSSMEFSTGTMDDFAEEILKCDLSDLPVIKGELGDTWIAGLGSLPDSGCTIGDVRRDFETISRFLEDKGDSEFEPLQREYIENLMLFGEHNGAVDVKKLISDRREYEKDKLLQALQTQPYLYAKSGWNDELKWCKTAREAVVTLRKKVKEKYGTEFQEVRAVCGEKAGWTFEMEDAKLVMTCLKTGQRISMGYLYEIIGRDTIDKYLDGYLRLKCDWSMADFGRYKMDGTNTYPDVTDRSFYPICQECSQDREGVTIRYSIDEESFLTYGNAETIELRAKVEGEKVHVSIDIRNKQPTMYVEAGYMWFDIHEKLHDVVVRKSGVEINPVEDIVLGANSALFAADAYVKANEVRIETVHSPLVCFGEPKIFRHNTGCFEMPDNGRVYFNLYNNKWSTGFPQWVCGSYHFEFYVSVDSAPELL